MSGEIDFGSKDDSWQDMVKNVKYHGSFCETYICPFAEVVNAVKVGLTDSTK